MARNKLVEQVKKQIQTTYNWLGDEEIDACYDLAYADYIRYKYPSKNHNKDVKNLIMLVNALILFSLQLINTHYKRPKDIDN